MGKFPVKVIEFSAAEHRRVMNVKERFPEEVDGCDGVVYQVPMPIEGDEFQINGVIFKITYQRDNPFRISAEPTGGVILNVIKDIVKAQETKVDIEPPQQS